MTIEIKTCGLTDPAAVRAAVDAGADMVGFVFFARSPRHIEPARAAELAEDVPAGILKVGLFVDPTDAEIEAVLAHVALDMIQLHGDELPQRVAEVREAFDKPVMKAVAIASPGDVIAARAYEAVADRLLFDAKPPEGAERPGGNALAFDWALIADADWTLPWMLAGGLTPENVAAAIRATNAPGVDVSSGIEDAPGRKNPQKIRAFIAAARRGVAAARGA